MSDVPPDLISRNPSASASHPPILEDAIRIRGARVHNLQNVDLDIPRDCLAVLTGLSGSGKSSLAFDTLFAEGQRRYLDSLSVYTRQFLDQLERPDVDEIDGLPPTLSIEQRVGSVQPRSTLATTTEIYDFLRLLYARAGVPHCIQCGRPVIQQSAQAIVDGILALAEGNKVMILAPLVRGRKGAHRELFESICRDGFVRARVDGEIIDASAPPELKKSKPHDIEVIVDRIVVKEGIRARLQESVELAVKKGGGACLVSYQTGTDWHDRLFSTRFACPDCEISLPAIEPRTFSFNSPYGACPACEGLGIVAAPAGAENGHDEGSGNVAADDAPPCPECHGARLGPVGRAVTIGGIPIQAFTAATVAEAEQRVQSWEGSGSSPGDGRLESPFDAAGKLVARKVLPEIASRLRFLNQVGLDYLSLDRPTRTLSGGEFQRAKLAGCLGSGLIGVCYILDEPTIGLHPRDTQRLLAALLELRNQGNSVLLVEHDLDIMRAADYLVDLGPGAGKEGGRIVASGTPREVAEHSQSLTAHYLRQMRLATSWPRRDLDWKQSLTLAGVSARNLRNVTLRVPLGRFVCVTGVSGSGKSTLIMDTLTPIVRRELWQREHRPRANGTKQKSADQSSTSSLSGLEHLARIVEVDQSPIGRTARSNPATASGMWDDIRRVFAQTREARVRGYKANRFSFNAKGGRCEECRGQGVRRIEMHFLPDLYVECPVCHGARFNRQTLQVRFRGKSIADCLAMRIDEATVFFENFAKLQAQLQVFVNVGLGYLTLGQSALTLSGGEAQRVKLATELSRPGTGNTLFVLDEPTTGLHPADVDRLLKLLQHLVDQGHTVLVIEHQLDVIAAADWVIDIGPEGGSAGGTIVVEGTPTTVAASPTSHTGRCLSEYLAAKAVQG